MGWNFTFVKMQNPTQYAHLVRCTSDTSEIGTFNEPLSFHKRDATENLNHDLAEWHEHHGDPGVAKLFAAFY